MDPLASLILNDRHISFKTEDEFLKTLERAESNRVPYLFLKKLSAQSEEKIVLKKYAELKYEKREYEEGAKNLLHSLMEHDVNFLVMKTARFSHISFDVDLYFKSEEDFQRSIPILIKSSIRPDPHVPNLRVYKGATIIIPIDDLWERKIERNLFGVDVSVPSQEDEAMLFLLHMIKHREIYLGDLLSFANLEIDDSMLRKLLSLYKLQMMNSYVSRLLTKYHIFDEYIQVSFPLIDFFLNILAEKQSGEFFPLTLPKSILYFSCLKLV